MIARGNMARACRASSSIPGIFEPVCIKDELGRDNLYLDGGVVGHHAIEEIAARRPDLDLLILNDFHKHNEDWTELSLNQDFVAAENFNRLVDATANEYNDLKFEILEQMNLSKVEVRPTIPQNLDLSNPTPARIKSIIQTGYEETLRILGGEL